MGPVLVAILGIEDGPLVVDVIPAVHVVDLAVAVVIGAVARDLERVHPRLARELATLQIHTRVDDRDNRVVPSGAIPRRFGIGVRACQAARLRGVAKSPLLSVARIRRRRRGVYRHRRLSDVSDPGRGQLGRELGRRQTGTRGLDDGPADLGDAFDHAKALLAPERGDIGSRQPRGETHRDRRHVLRSHGSVGSGRIEYAGGLDDWRLDRLLNRFRVGGGRLIQ